MNRNSMFVIGAVLIIFAVGAVQLLSTRSAVSPTIQTATSTVKQNVSTTTAPVIPVTNTNKDTKNPVTTHPLPLANGDNIVSWNFKGAYADNLELAAKAGNEIKRLSGLLTTATSSAMILSVGIANQYELLGDGKKQYEYLERAARTNPENGLPWHNLGVLMERLGAYETARIAYEKSAILQPQLGIYHYAYLEFLTTRMKDNATDIEKAFAAALANLGQDTDILQMYSDWKNS